MPLHAAPDGSVRPPLPHTLAARHRVRPRRRRRAPAPLLLAPIVLLMAAIVAAVLVPAARQDAAAISGSPNLVLDPDFEDTDGWTVSPGLAVAVGDGHDGHRALVLTNADGIPHTATVTNLPSPLGGVAPGDRFRVSAWVQVWRPASGPAVAVSLRAGCRPGPDGRQAVVTRWLRAPRWRPLTVDLVAPAAGAGLAFRVVVGELAPGASFRLSEPSVEPKGHGLAPAPLSTAALGPGSPSPSPVTSPTRSPKPTPSHSRRAAVRPTPHPSPTTASPHRPRHSAPAGPSVSAPPPPRDGSRLVFDDEFEGTRVDRSKWNVRNNSWASNEESIVTSRSRNVEVRGGVLTLRAYREHFTAYGTTREYTSGYLDTIGLSGFAYGRWEMRAKLPDARGLWPAFWLRGDHTPAEIDILEAIGGLPKMAVQTVFPSTDDGSVKKTHAATLSGSGISGWHVYGLRWGPRSMTWTIDGRGVFTVTAADAAWVSTAFTDTMNIRLNLQVGGSMPDYFDRPVGAGTAFPAEYQVDWVRVYSR